MGCRLRLPTCFDNMKKLFRSLFAWLFGGISGKIKYQKVFYFLYFTAIRGFNLSNIASGENGELLFMKNLSRFFRKQKYYLITVLDVGANVGDYTEHLIRELAGIPYKIHAFEPFPAVFEKLSANVRNQDNVTAHNFALGATPGWTKFYVDGENSELGSIFERDLSFIDIHFKSTFDVEVRRLDTFCAEQTIAHVHFLKIDVEGAELEVLKGAGELIDAERIDFIQFEFGAGNAASGTFMRDFYQRIENNYQIFRLLKDGLWPMGKYQNDHEIMILGNYIALSNKLLQTHKQTLAEAFGQSL